MSSLGLGQAAISTVADRFTLYAFAEVGSTMTLARELPEPSELPPGNLAAVIADRQTAGQGRLGNAWKSPAGTLSATLKLPFSAAPFNSKSLAQRPEVSFLVAIALRQGLIKQGVAAESVKLKWPNDVLINGAKVAGILLQAENDCLYIGTGVNVSARPDSDLVGQATTSVAEHAGGIACSPRELYISVLQALDDWLAIWLAEGFAPIRNEWIKQAHNLGGSMRARIGSATGTQVSHGTFDGIDEAGRLILRTTDGSIELISAGAVHFI